MRPARRTPVRQLLTVVVVAVLAAALLPAAPAVAVRITVDRRLFGLHDTDPTSMPLTSMGSIRLWDAGVTWRDIETSPGTYDFTRLDAIVAAAQARGVEVTLVLGMTPDFYGGATSYPSDPGAWTRYVTAVVTRYRSFNGTRGIHAYQVWNEANVKGYWTGSPVQMGELTRSTWNVVKPADRGALVVGPALAVRIAEQTRGLGQYYYARIRSANGYIPVWRFLDVISLNLYPLDRYGSKLGTPETSMSLLAKAKEDMQLRGVPVSGKRAKPIWNTEINYGLATGGTGASTTLSSERQAAYVLRTYLLNAARGVRRVHWYVWDRPAIGNTKMLGADAATPTLAGKAFGLAQSWMLNGTLVGASKTAQPCAKDRAGTYTCVIAYAGGVKRVYWNPSRSVKLKAARDATFKVGVYGMRTAVKSGATLRVDYRPLMVRSKS